MINHSFGDSMGLRDELDFDVGKILSEDGAELQKILNDPYLLPRVIAWEVSDQIEKREITERDFYEALGGDVLDKALVAWLEAVSDSLPKLQRRAMKALIERMETSLEIAATGLETKIRAKDYETEIKKKVEEMPL